MGRKPKGERALTNAERQKAYRDRRQPASVSQEFRLRLVHLVDLYEALDMDPDEIEATLEEFAHAYGMDLYCRRFSPREDVHRYLNRFYVDEGVISEKPIAKATLAKKARNERYRQEKAAEGAAGEQPLDLVENGKVAAELQEVFAEAVAEPQEGPTARKTRRK
jgi:hypothetical protein